MTGPKITAHLNASAIKHRMLDLDIGDNKALAALAGVDYTNLCRALNHDREPSRNMFLRLSVALGMDFNSLLSVSIEDPKKAAA